MTTSILISISMLIFSAIFSGMEIAFVSSNKIYLEIKHKKSDLLNNLLSKIIASSDKFISSLLIGNNITLVVYGIFSSDVILNLFFEKYITENLPMHILLFQTLIATVIVFFTAEFIPKILFLNNPIRMMNIFLVPTYIFYYVVNILGINIFVKFISDFFSRLILGKKFKENGNYFEKIELSKFLNEQIKNIDIDIKHEKSLKNEIEIIKNTLEFTRSKVRDCCVHRKEIKLLSIESSIADLIKMFSDTNLSKIIIYKDNIENIIGYVHVYEIFKKPKNIESILRPIDFFPETLSLHDGMNKLIKSKKSIAGVIDEYGEISGIVTLEDILEEIFGEIEDEFDSNNLKEVIINDNKFIFSSRLEVDYLNEKYNLNLPTSKDYDTLNGLVLKYFENIPKKGDSIIIEDTFRFVIEDVSDTRINTIKLVIINE